jgi:predicted DNA-binding protein YlxM (UPF0122 family)
MMHRKFDDHIVLFPLYNQVRFSEIADHRVDEFSDADTVPWSSGDCRLRKTSVFIEHFFNKTPISELAERFKVDDEAIKSAYKNARNQISKLIEALDARKTGAQISRIERFTKDQKYFMLVHVFGFSMKEVAEMFSCDHGIVELVVGRMARKYGKLFAEQAKKDDTTITDPPMSDKLTNAEIVRSVDAYFQQGLSKNQAFIRIAERLSALQGRHTAELSIKQRYYTAMAARKKKEPVKSSYEGKTLQEIKEMRKF